MKWPVLGAPEVPEVTGASGASGVTGDLRGLRAGAAAGEEGPVSARVPAAQGCRGGSADARP